MKGKRKTEVGSFPVQNPELLNNRMTSIKKNSKNWEKESDSFGSKISIDDIFTESMKDSAQETTFLYQYLVSILLSDSTKEKLNQPHNKNILNIVL